SATSSAASTVVQLPPGATATAADGTAAASVVALPPATGAATTLSMAGSTPPANLFQGTYVAVATEVGIAPDPRSVAVVDGANPATIVAPLPREVSPLAAAPAVETQTAPIVLAPVGAAAESTAEAGTTAAAAPVVEEEVGGRWSWVA